MAKKPLVMAAAFLGLTLTFSFLQSSTAHAVTTYTVTPTTAKTVSPNDCPRTTDLSRYTVLQGITNGSGSYVFMIFSDSGTNDTLLTRWIAMTDTDIGTLTCVGAKAHTDLGHGNDIAFQGDWSGGAKLLIPQGTKDTLTGKISVVDPWTLALVKVITAKRPLSGICYTSALNGKYVIRNNSHIYTYENISDLESGASINPTFTQGVISGVAEQGLYCNGSHIFTVDAIAEADLSNTNNYIREYNWSGTYIAKLLYGNGVPLKTGGVIDPRSLEAEGFFLFNGEHYVGVNRKAGLREELVKVTW